MKFAYGTIEEWLDNSCECETHEEAFAEAISELDHLEVGNLVYVSKVTDFIPSVNVDAILDNVTEDAYDQVGENVDSWPELTKDQTEILQQRMDKVLIDSLAEFKQAPHFFKCFDGKQFTVEARHLPNNTGLDDNFDAMREMEKE